MTSYQGLADTVGSFPAALPCHALSCSPPPVPREGNQDPAANPLPAGQAGMCRGSRGKIAPTCPSHQVLPTPLCPASLQLLTAMVLLTAFAWLYMSLRKWLRCRSEGRGSARGPGITHTSAEKEHAQWHLESLCATWWKFPGREGSEFPARQHQGSQHSSGRQ